MIDECWWDNVGPLLTALEKCEIDPVEWAMEPDSSELEDALEERGFASLGLTEQIHFAMGYLQATGNLTDITWAEQIADALAEEERKNAT